MACKGCLECLLKLLNFLLTLAGLGMVGYGIYLFVEYKNHSPSGDDHPIPFPPSSGELVQLGRPMLVAVSLANNIFDNLPKEWFLYLFIGIGVLLFVISCFGCIGASTRNGCCLSCYSVLVILLILVELGAAAFIFFDERWKKEIPTDRTGNFDMIYEFLEDNWKIVKWVALGAVVLEALMFLLALVVRAANRPADYDSDDEYIGGPRQQIRQPLMNNRQQAPVTGVPVAGTLDSRPSRNDAWSARMREKYGLDTSEFTYNPSESNRYQPTNVQPAEERGRCTIM
ncbi:PREDICTED: tobamovirus multiplication protein 2A [Ipomoea nil]|uniref:tobamovirus multiplication protein 2A n=1 Tax=Ipomoea nil TaxID=35883 RepID=UPI000900BB2F|nr:PREDICTED: tobamovirus multiplication protein 2A [Ipomoea nil]XP_019190901.1 PREDICTED: tobamovirus multiplication protein 2A [Ipomoea nil]XP_019190902.1 PREDICTED: tobamovirus multiplication protein 2A [Ipomoea nil]XP_019190903.1 PREDICTED: tobamovirus multiplication protein 2A [Ipomoea nil]XP_019190904.1 PREDICTED: tobamovirus multiplication protein 2A [Ipomoea nil]